MIFYNTQFQVLYQHHAKVVNDLTKQLTAELKQNQGGALLQKQDSGKIWV